MKEEFDSIRKKTIEQLKAGKPLLGKEDLHKLNEWIYSDPENQKYFEQQKRIWLLSAEYKNVSVQKNKPITDLRNESANIRVLRQER